MTNQTENTEQTQADSHFLFLDYETGGLNGRIEGGELGCESYPIFEVAAIITDSQLNEVGEPIRIVINQSEDSIATASEWAINTHSDSGLLDEVRTSTITLRDAEFSVDHPRPDKLKSLRAMKAELHESEFMKEFLPEYLKTENDDQTNGIMWPDFVKKATREALKNFDQKLINWALAQKGEKVITRVLAGYVKEVTNG